MLIVAQLATAQVNYGAAAVYGMRKLIPSYTGNAITVRRICDNATMDIGFTSCGDLDTTMLKAFVVASNPLTAMTGTAAAAFSLRRLKCTYSGSAIRVRSSASGSPTLDIGFTANGDLDTASLKAFIGSNSGYVTTWYDQSGNGRNASQATTTLQPRIVNAGSVERQNSMPAIRWLGMGYALATSPFTAFSSAACFNGVAKVNTDVTYNAIVNKTSSNLPAPIDFYNAQGVFGNGTTYAFAACSQSFSSAQPLGIWTIQYATGTFSYNFYYNSSSAGTATTIAPYGDAGTQLTLGSRVDGVTGLNGWISEVVTFSAIPSTADRQFLEWSQSQYYNISGPSLSAMPASPSTGYISNWYDQSGNGRHAAQATTTNQPRIVNLGIIDKSGSNPTIFFEGYPENLVAPLCTSVYPISISLLANTSGTSSGGAFVKHGTSVNGTDAGIAIGIGNSGGTFDATGNSVIGLKEWSAWCPSNPNITYSSTPFVSTTIQQTSASGMSTYLNGASVTLTNSASSVGATMSGSLYIGGYVNSANRYAIVKESELSVFSSSLSATRRVLLETNQAAYNNITITGSKYTPPTTTSYNRYVNGVGRESSTDSVAGTRSTTGMGFIVGQTANDFLKDNGDYLTIGMNCPYTPSTATTFTPATIVQRWASDWYLNKTDVGSNSGTVTIFFDFADYGVAAAPGVANNYELLTRTSTTSNFSIVTVATKSVSGSRVFFTVNTSSITTNNYYTIGTRSISTSPLPVELISFNADCASNRVDITWSTATQLNNDYFTIERTTDGVSFESVGAVKGAGSSSTLMHYAYSDEQPLAGTSYYRLRQTDFDGTFKTYKLTTVLCNDPTEVKVYPNPNNGSFIIEGVAQNTDISIISAIGRTIWQQKSTSLKQIVDAGEWQEGVYFLKIGLTNPVVKKLVIQR